jgi:hypothetical protein
MLTVPEPELPPELEALLLLVLLLALLLLLLLPHAASATTDPKTSKAIQALPITNLI